MNSPNLTFNLLSFSHPNDELTFYFLPAETEGLQRISKILVPNEVIQHFGEQEHFYTSFEIPVANGFSVTKPVEPVIETIINEKGVEEKVKVKNACFGIGILRRYYNSRIHTWFKKNGLLVKPNFIDDTEIWLPSNIRYDNETYKFFDKFSLKVQFARITKSPELLISFEGTSRVFKKSMSVLSDIIPPEIYTWVIFNSQLYRFDELPEDARRFPHNTNPVWNFDIKAALKEPAEAPDRGNKYLKYQNQINRFYNKYINTNEFKTVIPITSNGFVKVDELRIGKVTHNSNQLLFGKKEGVNGKDISTITGMKTYGPLQISPFSKIHLFFILHKSDQKKAEHIIDFFKGENPGFSGLQTYSHINFYIVDKFSFAFNDKDNPIPEIEELIRKRDFKDDVRYMAIYISPHSKHINDEKRKAIYYKIKELLLKNRISSQVLDAEKILNPGIKYHYSLPNIAIAMLAKLKGIPWRLDTQLKNELIIGVGAFKHVNTNVQYIGSAFSFQNNGTFNRFDCFRKNEVDELVGSILDTVKEYAIHNTNLNRLIIHFYKPMRSDELEPIETGLKNLGLNIPVFVVTINKTESTDIVAFDENFTQRIPLSGLYIKIGFNKYLLFNNTRYGDYPMKQTDGFPFPVKLAISCTDEELEKDPKIIREFIDQVYQFSRVYWKSLTQQNLPVTIKYPEMVAEMFPYFDGYEIPDFGKDNLWFL